MTGVARYAAEFPLAKLTYVVTTQSAIAKGKIAQINTRAAEQVPGVLAVITHLNAPKASGEKGGGRKLQVLQDNVVLYSGQHIAVIVADTFERAMYAAFLVEVRYDEEKPTDRSDYGRRYSRCTERLARYWYLDLYCRHLQKICFTHKLCRDLALLRQNNSFSPLCLLDST